MKRIILSLVAVLFSVVSYIPSSMAQTPIAPPAGLIAWWPGDSNTLDIINGSSAALINGATFSMGRVDGAFAFDGVNDYAEVAPAAAPSFAANSEATVEFWIFRTKASLPLHFLGKRNGCAPGVVNYQSAIDASSPTFPLNQWVHWAQVYSSNSTKIYTNGVLYVSTGSGIGASNTVPLEFAHSDNCSDSVKFGGLLDEISIYNRALSTNEIAGIVAAGSAGKDKGAIAPLVTVLGAATNRIFLNGSITYSARVLNTAGNLQYQWLRDGVVLSNETNLTLTLPAQTNAGTSTVSFRAQNSLGTNSASTVLVVRSGLARSIAPLAQWHFDETPGATNAADSSTNGFTGVLAATGATFTNEARWGNALALSNSWVSMGSVLPGTGTDFTMVLWVRTTNTASAVLAGRHQAGTANGYFVAINSQPGYGAANKASLVTSTPGNTGRDPRSVTSINDGQWHQIVAVHRGNGSQNQIFVDGAPVESSTGADVVAANAAQFLIGAVMSGSTPVSSFEGLIDELQFYGRALSDDQIDYLFTHPSAPAVYEQDLPPNTYVWSDPVDGNWSDPQRWTPYGVPGAGATVLITNAGNYTVVSASSVAVNALWFGFNSGLQTLRQTGGTLTVTNLALGANGAISLAGGSLTTAAAFEAYGVVNQNGGTWRMLNPGSLYNYNLTNGELRGSVLTVTIMNWIDGNMNSDGAGDKTIIAPGGVLNFLGPNDRFLSYYVQPGRGLDNYGTWNWIGSGNLRGNGGAVVNNYGTVVVSTNAQFNYGGSAASPVWNNLGTFRRTAGTGTFYFNGVYLNNASVIENQAGTLSLYGSTVTNRSGALIALAAGTVLLNENSSSFTLLADSAVSTPDTNSMRLASGAMYVQTTDLVTPSIWIQGGVLYQQTNIVVSQINQSGGAFQLTTPGAVATYNLTNGELRGRDLIVTNMTWYDGNQNSAAPGEPAPSQPDRTIIPAGGVVNILGAADRAFSYHIGRGRGFDNYGTINWSAAIQLRGNNGSVFNNYGEVNITAGAPNVQFDFAGGGAAPVFNNYGTVRRTSGVTTLYFDSVYLNNYGVIDIQTGTLSIYGSTATNAGAIAMSAGTLLLSENGTEFALRGDSQLSAPDVNTVRLVTGNLYLSSTNVSTPAVWIQGGNWHQFTNIVVPQINQSAGAFTMRVPSAVSQYNLTNGELRGRDLTVTNFNWYDGNLNASFPSEGGAPVDRTIIPPGGIATLFGNAARYLSYYFGPGRTFENFGTFNWSGSAVLYGQGGARFNNYGAVNVTAAGNAQFAYGGTGAAAVWNNFGAFTKSTGSNTFHFNGVVLNQSNAMTIDSGTLSYYGSTATNRTGSVMQLGAGVIFVSEAGSETTLEAGAVISGSAPNAVRINSGNVYWRSAEVSVPSLWIAGGTLWQETNSVTEINQSAGVWRPTRALSVPNFNMTNGELRGANVALNNFNWAGGALNSDGPGSNLVTVANSLNIYGNAAKSMSYWTAPGRSILHSGAGTWGGATITGQGGATICNTGSLVMTNGSGLAWGGTGARAVFENAGTFSRTGAVGTATFTLVTNSGALTVEVGALSIESLIQTAGTAQLGTNFTAGGEVRNLAGLLSGRGTVSGPLYNGGTLNPGASPGFISATTFTNTSAAALNIELGAASGPGTNYDQVRLSGAANLAGDLKVSLANNFAPQLSNRFTIVTTSARVGTFGSVVPPPGVTLNTIYNSTNVILEVVGLTNAPLEVTQFPSNQVVWTPDPVTFTVGASGVTPITFQWQFEGTNIVGATNTAYSIPTTATTNAGTYSVLIIDGNGATTNVSAMLTVIPFTGSMYWTNVAGGNWSIPANWSPNRVPGAGNNAFILSNGTYTVTVDSAQSASNLVVGATNSSGTPTLYIAPGGTLTLVSNSIVETNAVLNLSGLWEARGGTNDIRGQIVWFTGTLNGPGNTIVRSNANIYFTGSQQTKQVVSNIIENYGSFTYSRDAGIGSGQLLRFSGGAHLTNHIGGVLNMKDNSFQYSGAQTPRSYLVNYGTIVTTSPGVFSPSYIFIEFINYGLLDNQGYVYLARGTNFGEMKCINSLAEISIFGDPNNGEYFSFEPGTALTSPNVNIACAGPVQWRAGNSVHPGRLFIAQGSGGATYPNAEFKVLANYTNTAQVSIMRGALTITNPAITTHLKSYTDAFQSFWSFYVTNAGTMYVDNFSHSLYTIGNGGDLIIRTNGNFAGGVVTGGGRIVISNAATFSGGSINAHTVENFGSVTATAASPFTGNTLFFNRTNAQVYFAGGSFTTGPAALVNHGLLHGYGGVQFSTTNYAQVRADDSLQRTLTIGYLKQLAGETRLENAVLAGTVEIDAGSIGGDFRVQGSLRNGAMFVPGNPFGAFAITGGFTNLSTGVQLMPIRSAQQGSGYPQVSVSGTAQLAGTLLVSFTNGFYPVIGNSYTAMTYTARSGQFDQIVTPDYDFDIQYFPNALVLRASNALPNITVSAPATQLVCTPFTFSAAASDTDGTVTNLDLLFGTNVIGSFAGNAGSVRVLFDFPGMATFAARATDDRGGVKTVATNVMYVTMPLHALNLGGFLTNQSEFKLCMLGESGSNYVVQAAEVFSHPSVTNWQDIGPMFYTNGIFRYWDTNATNFDRRYYRARLAP